MSERGRALHRRAIELACRNIAVSNSLDADIPYCAISDARVSSTLCWMGHVAGPRPRVQARSSAVADVLRLFISRCVAATRFFSSCLPLSINGNEGSTATTHTRARTCDTNIAFSLVINTHAGFASVTSASPIPFSVSRSSVYSLHPRVPALLLLSLLSNTRLQVMCSASSCGPALRYR